MTDWQVITGDCLEVMREMDAGSVDAVVTDPPAGISFMGKDWDGHKGGRAQWVEWMTAVMAECLRVLKPGGHALVWALPRTAHWTACAVEDAGFEIRDKVYHLFGSGFPKSLDIGKAIDKMAGAERETTGRRVRLGDKTDYSTPRSAGTWKGETGLNDTGKITAPATPAAVQWDGWGTSLKPAVEEWILARKPIEGTVAANVLKYGTGGLNIGQCRVEVDPGGVDDARPGGNGTWKISRAQSSHTVSLPPAEMGSSPLGRYPAHLIHDGSPEVLAGFPAEGRSTKPSRTGTAFRNAGMFMPGQDRAPLAHSDNGGSAARFFYCAKASRQDRNEGLDGFEEKTPWASFDGQYAEGRNPKTGERTGQYKREQSNHHPTVKPTALMRYLCRLITPPGGVILDPFTGSGSTGKGAVLEGFNFIGVEQDSDYADIARARIAKAAEQARQGELFAGQ